MPSNILFGRFLANFTAAIAIVLVGLCGLADTAAAQPPSEVSKYVIGPGDALQISVWHNPELSTTVPVRPDGRISTPLVTDIVAAGRTSEELGHEIEARLKKYVSDPLVTVIITSFVGPYNQQVRIVGEASTPKSLPYMAHMTVLDAMIAVGGLTPYASGNRAKLVRRTTGKEVESILRISDLLKNGDLSANTELQPGDIIIIPQSFF